MATWIIGGMIAAAVVLVIWKMTRNKRAGRGGCACGGNCGQCGGCGR